MIWIASLAFTLCLSTAPRTQEQAETSLADAYVDLEDEFDAAVAAWYEELRTAAESELIAVNAKNPAVAFYPRFFDLASKGHCPAKAWCLEQFPHSGTDPVEAPVRKLALFTDLIENHANDDWVERVLTPLRHDTDLGSPLIESLIAQLGRTTENEDIRALALYTQASVVADRGADFEQRGVELFKRFTSTFPEHEYRELADGRVFGIEKLKLGMVAPEIVAEDVDGFEIKLSDSRGKVTVIDFWGFW